MSCYQVASAPADFDRLKNLHNCLEKPNLRVQNRVVDQLLIRQYEERQDQKRQDQERPDISKLMKLQTSHHILTPPIGHPEIRPNFESFSAVMKAPELRDFCVDKVHCFASKLLSRLFAWRNPTESRDEYFQRRVVVTEFCLPVISIIATVEMIAYATLTYTLSFASSRYYHIPNFFPLFESSAKTVAWSVSAMVYDNFFRMSLETDENDFYKRITKWCDFR